MRSWLLGLWLLSAASSAAPAQDRRPTSAALRKAFETSRRTVVEVVGPHRSGLGVIIGAQGQVLTSVDYVGLYDAQVKREGATLPAQVRAANAALQVAVVQITGAGELPSSAVRLDRPLVPGAWLVAVEADRRGGLKPVLTQVRRGQHEGTRFVELDHALVPGSPLFDPTGKLVAMAVGTRGRRGRLVVPVPEVKAELSRSEAP